MNDNDQPTLAPGRWAVDGAQSTAGFTARGFWGAVPVSGSLPNLSGSAVLDHDGSFSGELSIRTDTLNTGLKLRDHHLKSGDFFDVNRYPLISFRAAGLTGNEMRGTLTVRDRTLELALPVELRRAGKDRVELTAATTVERAALGLGRSPLGMIRGAAKLQVRVVLKEQT